MGKKSRRPNREKKKDIPAAASTAVAAVVAPLTQDQLNHLIATFNQLYNSRDWEGALALESQMTRVAKIFEIPNPSYAGRIYHHLADIHRELGREGSMEQVILYYKKHTVFAKKAGDNDGISVSVFSLAKYYVMMDRVDEAMDLHKSLCDEIGKERMEPHAIISFTEILNQKSESRALTILGEYLDVIERTWGEPMKSRALIMIAALYSRKNDFSKSIFYLERQLPIAKEIKKKDLALEGSALNGLGHNYVRMGEFGIAMDYFEQALAIACQLGDRNNLGMTYADMGDLFLAQAGREMEAIEMFQKACRTLKEGSDAASLSQTFRPLGEAYTKIEAWDDAIASLEKSISIAESIEEESIVNLLKAQANQALGKTYLEQYYTDESLVGIPERKDELIRKALFCSEAASAFSLSSNEYQNREGSKRDHTLYLDLAQEHYFLGDSEKAHNMLKKYLDATVKMGPSHCQRCYQICAKDAIMEKCSVCKVARYCSGAHSIQAWKKGRLCHKVMCPLLKSWRKMNPPGTDTTVSYDELFNDFFERVFVSKPK